MSMSVPPSYESSFSDPYAKNSDPTPPSAPPSSDQLTEKYIRELIESRLLQHMREEHQKLDAALKNMGVRSKQEHILIDAKLQDLQDKLERLQSKPREVATEVLRDDGHLHCKEVTTSLGEIYKLCCDHYGRCSVSKEALKHAIRPAIAEEHKQTVAKLASDVADLTTSNEMEHNMLKRRLGTLERRIRIIEDDKAPMSNVLGVATDMLRERGVRPGATNKAIYELCRDMFGGYKLRQVSTFSDMCTR